MLRSGSGLTIVSISLFENLAGVELRSRSGIRGDFRNHLQVRRSSSRLRLSCYSITLGKRRAAPDLLLGAPLVFARAWSDLLNRVRVALGASRWIDRQRWDVAPESIPTRGSRATWTRGLHPLANSLLV